MRRIVVTSILLAVMLGMFGLIGAGAATVTTVSGQGCAIVNQSNTTDSCTFTINTGNFLQPWDGGVGGVYTGTARITHLFTAPGGIDANGDPWPDPATRPNNNYTWNATTNQWEYLKIYWTNNFMFAHGACQPCSTPYKITFDTGIPLTLTLTGQGFVAAGYGE